MNKLWHSYYNAFQDILAIYHSVHISFNNRNNGERERRNKANKSEEDICLG